MATESNQCLTKEDPANTPRARRKDTNNHVHFTKAAVIALPRPAVGKVSDYFDTKQPGLQARVMATGTVTFNFYRWAPALGRATRVKIGRFPEMSIEEARRKCAELSVQVTQGIDPAEAVRDARSELTLQELFDHYIVNRRTKRGNFLSPKTIADYKGWFRLYLTPWAARRISQLTDRHVADLHTRLGRIHVYAANRVLSLIQGLYSHAADWKFYNKGNPAQRIGRFREHRRKRLVERDEMPAFFQGLAEEPNVSLRDYILLSLLTGARRENVLSMRWEDIYLEREEWLIPRTKGGDPQTVALSLEAIEVLKQRGPKSEGFVFPSNSKRGHIVEPKRAWQRVLKRAGLDNLRLHDLRRTFGSYQAKTGSSLIIVGESLGHSSPSSTSIYTCLDLDPVRESVDRATDAMLRAGRIAGTTAVTQKKREKA